MPASSAAPPERLTLSGPSCRPDPRIHAYRADLADVRIAGKVFALHYARPGICFCVAPSTIMRAIPQADAPAVSQLLYGEAFEMLDRTSGWAWGRSAHDGYVGYIAATALQAVHVATHRVVVREALLFAQPDIKSTVRGHWPIGAQFAACEVGAFFETEHGYVHQRHAAPLTARLADPVELAERLIGTPYLWGGRGAGGIDCSGLVQLALSFAGITAPRDSDQQRAVGSEIGENDMLRRGDLIFFPGHVGFMATGDRIVHANAHWMAVTVEPLADVVARLAPTHAQPILARRRIT